MKPTIAFIIFLLALPYSSGAEPSSTQQPQKGKPIYEKLCSGCHGVTGRGDGPAADRLRPRPRNFARGQYKFTYTKFGKLPQDKTLFRWISEGLPGSSMPPWKDVLTEEERWDLVAYIKTFSRKFARAKKKGRVPKPIVIGTAPPSSAEDIREGKELFLQNCAKCHGKEGRGAGPSAPTLKDSQGDRIWPRNLTKGWLYRGGGSPEDIYRTVATGITGTPMPEFMDSLSPEKIWRIVAYVESIRQKKRPPINDVLVSKHMQGDLPSNPCDPAWQSVPSSYIPLAAQVIEGERWFKTTIESVEVRSVYNGAEVAIHVEWADKTQSPLTAPPDKFPQNGLDALAVQLPVKMPLDAEKPYFLGGSSAKPVILWKWTNGGRPEVFLGKGILKMEPLDREHQTLRVAAVYKAGLWKTVFIRSLERPAKNDITIEAGKYLPIAFSAWDGNNGEKDAQRAVSIWYSLLLKPPVKADIYLWPLFVGLLIAVGEMALAIKVKKEKEK